MNFLAYLLFTKSVTLFAAMLTTGLSRGSKSTLIKQKAPQE